MPSAGLQVLLGEKKSVPIPSLDSGCPGTGVQSVVVVPLRAFFNFRNDQGICGPLGAGARTLDVLIRTGGRGIVLHSIHLPNICAMFM